MTSPVQHGRARRNAGRSQTPLSRPTAARRGRTSHRSSGCPVYRARPARSARSPPRSLRPRQPRRVPRAPARRCGGEQPRLPPGRRRRTPASPRTGRNGRPHLQSSRRTVVSWSARPNAVPRPHRHGGRRIPRRSHSQSGPRTTLPRENKQSGVPDRGRRPHSKLPEGSFLSRSGWQTGLYHRHLMAWDEPNPAGPARLHAERPRLAGLTAGGETNVNGPAQDPSRARPSPSCERSPAVAAHLDLR